MEIIQDTIVGIATPPGEGGISIIRMSGPASLSILQEIFYSKRNIAPFQMKSNCLYYGWIQTKIKRVDEVLAVIMRKPFSYTREDVVEIHCHGGMIPVRDIIHATVDRGARIADPGEFTKRAFLHGRIDLSQAEAVMDLIRSKTDLAAQTSLEQLEGRLSSEITALQNQLLDMLAFIEVSLDYPEEDIDSIRVSELKQKVLLIEQSLQKLYESSDTGRIIREGLKTAIIGRPNVGKSSLLNALLKQNRAIVTDIPGTTRDILEESLNIKGLFIRIIDTAGIREAENMIEALGVVRTKEAIKKADLVLFVVDITDQLQYEDWEIIKMIDEKPCIVIGNKMDLKQRADAVVEILFPKHWKWIELSAKVGTGIHELEEMIADSIFHGRVKIAEETIISNTRHRQVVGKAIQSLKQAIDTMDQKLPLDFVSIDIKDAWQSLGEITGQTVVEDIIDRIFSSFCLGK